MSRVIEAVEVDKSFLIPSVQRRTVREFVRHLFAPRRFERLTVLDKVSFSVEAGESVAIMGRNGCGKSTLLKVISGIYQPDAGRVTVRGSITPILELGVGFNKELTARDNIFLSGTAMGMSIAEIRQRLDEIVAFAEVERFVDLELKHFSSGMGARLASAIALCAVRDVLLVDEILAVGDAAFAERCLQRYRELHASGRAIVFVSHDVGLVQTFCTRAVLLEKGRLIQEGDAASVAAGYQRLLGVHAAEPPAQRSA